MPKTDSFHWVRALPTLLSLKTLVSKISKVSLVAYNENWSRTGQASKSPWSSYTTLGMVSWTTLSMQCAMVDKGPPSTSIPSNNDWIPWASIKALMSWVYLTAAGRSWSLRCVVVCQLSHFKTISAKTNRTQLCGSDALRTVARTQPLTCVNNFSCNWGLMPILAMVQSNSPMHWLTGVQATTVTWFQSPVGHSDSSLKTTRLMKLLSPHRMPLPNMPRSS